MYCAVRLAGILLLALAAAHCGGGGGGGDSGGGGSSGTTPTPVPVTPASTTQVNGRVIDGETRAPIAGATLQFAGTTSGQSSAPGVTSSAPDGSFVFSRSGAQDTLTVTASATGYVPTTLQGASVSAPTTQLESILLVRQTATPGSISGTVRNARNNDPVPSSQIYLVRGQTPFIDGTAITKNADSQGGFAFNQLSAGTYTLLVFASGFRSGQRTAITVVTGAVTAQDVVLSPSDFDQIRIVLTWGATPSDLDSHLTGPNADPSRFHLYFGGRGNLSAAPFAALDLDDTSSFGPETITVSRFNSGIYRYSVHDYTNRSVASSTALGTSGAKVELYLPSQALPMTFFVPNQRGNLWTVFELSGSIASPTVRAVNDVGLAEDPAAILFERPTEASAPATDAAAIGVAAQKRPKE